MGVVDLTLVSGGDAAYFPLLEEQLRSVRRLPGGADVPVVMLDGGLQADQIQALERLDARVIDPGWCHSPDGRRSRGRTYLKINIAKAHLDRLLPDSDIIVWLDGDTWVQSLDVLALLRMVAAKDRLAIVSEASRYQVQTVGFRRAIGPYVELRNHLFKNARRAGLPWSIVMAMAGRPTLNAGVFAARRDAPHWARWRHWQDQVLRRGRLFTSDQLVIGLGAFVDGLSYETVPETCNYRGPWRWDAGSGLFVEYHAPYTAVSVVHLAEQNAMRRDPKVTVAMVDTLDRPMVGSLRFGQAPSESGARDHPER